MCVHPGASVEVTHVSKCISLWKQLNYKVQRPGVLVSSEHPRLIWTRILLMIQHVVGMLLRRSFLSWQYVVAAHFNG